jgi:hypothetical protein
MQQQMRSLEALVLEALRNDASERRIRVILKNLAKDQTNVFRKKPAPAVNYVTIKKELAALISKAETAHVNRHTLIDLLEDTTDAIRSKIATSYCAMPRMHSGNV